MIVGPAVLATLPAEFDITGKSDTAKIDISSPRLDPRKDLFEDAARTIGRAEFEPGDTIYYRIVMTNSGTGDAYNVTFEDDFGNDSGINRMVVVPGVDQRRAPAAAACALDGTTPDKMSCTFVGPLAGDLDGPGRRMTGGQIIVEYAATPLPSSQLISPLTFDPWEPDIIRNTVSAVDYTEVVAPGPARQSLHDRPEPSPAPTSTPRCRTSKSPGS